MTTASLNSVQVKRQVVLKTLVNAAFRSRAQQDLGNEIKLIEDQLNQLETQYQKALQQLETMAQQGQNVNPQLSQLNQEVQGKRTQLTTLKMEVSNQLGNLDKVPDGDYVVTGMLEGFVDLKVGDNVYQVIQRTEVLLSDGIVQDIRLV